MIAEDILLRKIHSLPPRQMAEVSEFVDSLLETNGKVQFQGAITQRVDALRNWAGSHSKDRSVLLDDSREVIYED